MKSFIFIITTFLFFLLQEDRAKGEKVDVYSAMLGECDYNSNPYLLLDRIKEQSISGDTLQLLISFKDECCIEISPQVVIVNDTMKMSFNKNEFVAPCDCFCCYEMDLKLKAPSVDFDVVQLNGKTITKTAKKYKTVPETFYLYRGDTINRTDTLGFPTGLWLSFDTDSSIIARLNYRTKPDQWTEDLYSYVTYNKQGLIKRQRVEDSTSIFTYYESQELKSRTTISRAGQQEETFYPNGIRQKLCYKDTCLYWDKMGNPTPPKL